MKRVEPPRCQVRQEEREKTKKRIHKLCFKRSDGKTILQWVGEKDHVSDVTFYTVDRMSKLPHNVKQSRFREVIGYVRKKATVMSKADEEMVANTLKLNINKEVDTSLIAAKKRAAKEKVNQEENPDEGENVDDIGDDEERLRVMRTLMMRSKLRGYDDRPRQFEIAVHTEWTAEINFEIWWQQLEFAKNGGLNKSNNSLESSGGSLSASK